jgi:hypothetical protein
MRRGEIFSAPCIWANSEFLEAPFASLQYSFRLEDEHAVPVIAGRIVAVMNYALGVYIIQP